jgi:protein tyrosine/serine phosphatase
MSRNRIRQLLIIISVLAALAGIISVIVAGRSNEPINTDIQAATNQNWAVETNLPGVPNFHKVSSDLYRGAQPSIEGMRQLEKLGIKTVINLRSLHSDRDELKDVNLDNEHISMKAWHPEREDVVRFLKIVTDANRTPVFVHCQYGADRTGTMCAIYRIAIQGWPKEKAIEEMTKGDFGFHGIWDNLVDYIRGLDIEQIKRLAGIPINRD